MLAAGYIVDMNEIQSIDSDQPRRRTGRGSEGFQPIGLILRRLAADLIAQRVAAAHAGRAAAGGRRQRRASSGRGNIHQFTTAPASPPGMPYTGGVGGIGLRLKPPTPPAPSNGR